MFSKNRQTFVWRVPRNLFPDRNWDTVAQRCKLKFKLNFAELSEVKAETHRKKRGVVTAVKVGSHRRPAKSVARAYNRQSKRKIYACTCFLTIKLTANGNDSVYLQSG